MCRNMGFHCITKYDKTLGLDLLRSKTIKMQSKMPQFALGSVALRTDVARVDD